MSGEQLQKFLDLGRICRESFQIKNPIFIQHFAEDPGHPSACPVQRFDPHQYFRPEDDRKFRIERDENGNPTFIVFIYDYAMYVTPYSNEIFEILTAVHFSQVPYLENPFYGDSVPFKANLREEWKAILRNAKHEKSSEVQE